MLEFVKNALRISENDFDEEIDGLIKACKSDLKSSGIAGIFFAGKIKDPLIRQAIVTYCKAEFGFDNPEAERFKNSYELLKAKLAITHKEMG